MKLLLTLVMAVPLRSLTVLVILLALVVVVLVLVDVEAVPVMIDFILTFFFLLHLIAPLFFIVRCPHLKLHSFFVVRHRVNPFKE